VKSKAKMKKHVKALETVTLVNCSKGIKVTRGTVAGGNVVYRQPGGLHQCSREDSQGKGSVVRQKLLHYITAKEILKRSPRSAALPSLPLNRI
jgi:hypothetical protein